MCIVHFDTRDIIEHNIIHRMPYTRSFLISNRNRWIRHDWTIARGDSHFLCCVTTGDTSRMQSPRCGQRRRLPDCIVDFRKHCCKEIERLGRSHTNPAVASNLRLATDLRSQIQIWNSISWLVSHCILLKASYLWWLSELGPPMAWVFGQRGQTIQGTVAEFWSVRPNRGQSYYFLWIYWYLLYVLYVVCIYIYIHICRQ